MSTHDRARRDTDCYVRAFTVGGVRQFKEAIVKTISSRANPLVLGVLAMFAISFVYVELQPEYAPIATDSESALSR